MFFKKTKAFTLVELLIAVLVLAGAIGGVLLLYTNSMLSSQLAWDTTVATSHAEHVLEDMHLRDSLESITAVQWQAWARTEGLTTLPGEKIAVAFANPERDPLDIEVTVHWTRKSRELNVLLKTMMTK